MIGLMPFQSLPLATGNDWIYAFPILTSSYRDCLLLKLNLISNLLENLQIRCNRISFKSSCPRILDTKLMKTLLYHINLMKEFSFEQQAVLQLQPLNYEKLFNN